MYFITKTEKHHLKVNTWQKKFMKSFSTDVSATVWACGLATIVPSLFSGFIVRKMKKKTLLQSHFKSFCSSDHNQNHSPRYPTLLRGFEAKRHFINWFHQKVASVQCFHRKNKWRNARQNGKLLAIDYFALTIHTRVSFLPHGFTTRPDHWPSSRGHTVIFSTNLPLPLLTWQGRIQPVKLRGRFQ